jgi:hypothetical protein
MATNVYSEQQPVFLQDITVYRGADFIKQFFYEDRSVSITNILEDAVTTVTTEKPHYLTTGGYVNLRGIEGSERVNDSFVATVTSPNSFTIPLDTTGLNLTLGTANRPVNLTGWQFVSEMRSAVSADPPGVLASISLSDPSSIILDGNQDFVVGDEITVSEAGLTNAKIISIVPKPTSGNPQFVARINAIANGAVTKVAVVRNTKLIATFTCSIVNQLTGRFKLSLSDTETLAIAAPQGRFYYDVKYKSGDIVTLIIKGRANIESLSTQLSI